MTTIPAGGRRIEFTWHGPGPDVAPTLVFLHDGIGCAATWRDFPAALARETGCGALVYSRAGYGGSDPVPLPRPLTYMHDEGFLALPELLDAAGVRQAFLVGHSDGGSIALLHASTPRSLPRVRGLLLEAPHVFCEEITVRAIEKARDEYLRTGLRGEARTVPWRERRLRLLGMEPGLARSGVSRLEHRGLPARRHGPGARGPGDRRSVRDPSPGRSDRAAMRRTGPAVHPRAVRPHPASRTARPDAFGDGRVRPRDHRWEHPVKGCRPLRRRCRARFTIATPSRSPGICWGNTWFMYRAGWSGSAGSWKSRRTWGRTISLRILPGG